MLDIGGSIVVFVLMGMIGEGYSSASPSHPIEAGWRMFTIYTGQEACADAALPATLTSEALSRRVGDKFQLTMAVVVAYDDRGKLIPRVPISIEEPEPEGVLVRDMHANELTWIAQKVGRAQFSVGSLCSRGSATTTIDVIVEQN